jgi:phosphoserine phosphatase
VYARIARLEGVDADRMQEMANQIKGEAGPPEGVPATRFLLLLDRAGGTSLVISSSSPTRTCARATRTLNA